MNQNILVKLANESEIVRDYLGVKGFKNITKITANSVHRQIGENQFKGTFVGKRKYKDNVTTNQLIRLAGGGVWDFLKRKYGETVLWDEFYNQPFFQPSLLKYDSATFEPVSGAVSPVDGHVKIAGVDQAWATIQATSAGSAVDNTGSVIDTAIIASATSGQYTTISKGAYCFDTSSISGGEVSSADLKLNPSNKTNNFGTTMYIVVTGVTLASTAAVATGDFDAFGTTAFSSTYDISTLPWAYQDYALNASGISAINTSGVTELATRIENDRADSAPTWSASKTARLYASSADSGASEPQLDVVWSAAPTGPAASRRITSIM